MWYEEYKWSQNPFNAKYNTNLVGFDKQKETLKSYMQSGDMCLLTGEAGSGKTSLLKWLQKNVKGHRMLYLSAEGIDEPFDLEKHVRTFIRRKKVVLLLDEAQFCDEKVRMQLKQLWDNGKIKSAIIAQLNADLANYGPSIRSRIGNRVIRLSKMNLETARELIGMRTEGKSPFTDEMIEEIVRESNKNPRKILETCETLCISLAGKEFTMRAVKEIMEQKKKESLLNLELLDEPTLPDNLAPTNRINVKGFSPMQQRLLKLLFEGNRTSRQLSKIMNTSEGSVGKQLSNLIEQNAVHVINHRRPKTYGLLTEFRSRIL